MKLKSILIPVVIIITLGSGLWVGRVSAQEPEEARQFIGLMNQYLELADKVVKTANHPEGAVFMAIEGIFEVYEQRRDAPGAVRHLNRILEANRDNQTVRNLVRFKLRDIHKETGELDKALEQLDAIVSENT